jgi:Ca2+-binding RTX toxin-like protein
MYAGNGAAEIFGGNGNHHELMGGAGNDLLIAGTGNDVLAGGTGDDTLVAGGGADYLAGQSGNDSLVGGSGGDAFAFAAADGDGSDTVGNYHQGSDVLVVNGYGISSPSQLSISQSNADAVISTSPASAVNEVITLTSFTASNLNNGDFLFG